MATGENSRKSFSIVGIGASAGGLNALQRFLAELPAHFGFALVFIQHLSSKHKSLLSELLSARRPSLVIQQISDGLKIQPGILYLAPPGREVRLRNSLFQTTVHPEGLIHLPIDEFLASLAEDVGERSIAAIFSGAGTDGSRGCQAIRSKGGTVFIQDPNTAEFDSMPLSAIATGQADAVLSPEDIAAELLKLQGIGLAAGSRELPITPEEFEGFFRIIREKTGSRFDHFKKSVVSRRIRRRMYLHGLSVVKDYLGMLATSDPEAAHLASDLMIGVTSFFRDRVAWKALNLEAIRKIVAENTGLPVRVWTPASATGEEAYSIAMMLLHELALAGKKRDIQVFATDVNERALERAREGKYPASITADVPQEYIQKYFTSTDGDNFLVIHKDVRECVVFARQDLLTDPPFSRLDLIICRNFLIYLEPEAQEKSITLFHYALKEGGYLFLGNAENVGRKSAAFKSIGHKQCRVYRKLETKAASRLPISVPYARESPAPPAGHAQLSEQGRPVMEIIQEKLLEEYGPASVAIDQNYQIIYHNGPTNRYLHQPRGVPTQNLLELVPENLRSRIRGALYRSGREERPVLIRTSVAGDDNKARRVTLRITKAAENLHIVVFQEKSSGSKKEAVEQVDAAVIEETAIHQLESELSATKADLQSHIEQLKSMNEEFQSSNEELQAANEELETSREELQSLNEELVTVNSQLQGKIEEQEATNDDLNNFQASTNIPMIFLDTHFRVKRFTAAMLKFIKLLPSDIGRPIVDMSQENLGPDLTSDAQSVLEDLVPARKELEISGAWYVRTTLPYRTADNRIEGVVITYNDVSELKKSEERTQHLASFPELNPNPICEVHSSGKVTFCNPATEKVLVSLGMGTDDLTVFLPEDMDDILRDLDKKEEASLYREKAIRGRVFGMTVHLAPQFNVARIYVFDITERKRAEEALRESEAKYRSLFDNMINGFAFHQIVVDEAGKPVDYIFREVNSAFEKLTGLKAADIQNKNVTQALPGIEKDPADWIGVYGKVALTGEVLRLEQYAKPLGKWFSVMAYSPMRNYFATVFEDITERKRAEEALEESERKFSLLFQKAAFGASLATMPEGVIVDANEEFLRIFGYTKEEVIGKNTLELGMNPDAEARARMVADLMESGYVRDVETRLLTKSGEERIFLISIIVAEFGGRKYNVSTIVDITERKRAEEALRESEARLSLAQQVAHVGTFEWNIQAGVNTWTPELEAMYGLQPGEFGRTQPAFENLVHPEDRAEVMRLNARAIETGEPMEGEWRVIWPDDAVHWVAGRWRVFKDSEGKPLRMTGVNIDITERKRAEEALRQSEKQYRELFENMIEGYAYCKMVFENGKPQDFIYLSVNHAFEKLTGLTNVVGKSVTEVIPGIRETDKELFEIYGRVAHTCKPERFEMFVEALKMWFSISVYCPEQGFFVAVFDIITERKKAEEALLRLNKALKALSDSSQAIIRAADEPEYLDDVCRIIVEDCGYSMAWIGFAEDGEAKPVRPAAYSGFEEGYLETLKLTWADTDRGRGPTGTAIRTGNVAVCRNMLTDPAFTPWREEAIKRGYASSIVFPLRADGRVFGAITIYSTEADPFSNGEIKLLTELADNLAHGIEFLRVRAAREQAEEALRESESRFRLALKNSPVSVAIQDNNLVYQWAYNQRTRRPDEVVGKTDADLFAPEDLPPILEAKRRVLESGIEEHTGMWLTRNGRRLFFDLYYEPMRDASGNITGVGIATVNLTDQKLAEVALRESEEQFRALADSIPNLAWWANGDGYITWYNRRWYEYTGTTLEQMEGWGWQSVHDPEALPKVLEQWKASIATGEPFEMEFPLRGHDGIFRAFLTRGMPVKDSAGRVVRWFGTNTDVSSLKEAEDERERLLAEVQRHVAELDAVFKVLPYLVSVHDRDGKYLRVNQAVIDLFGFDPTTTTREEIARRLKAHFPDGRPLTPENMPSSKSLNGETVKDVEYVIANERGEEHALLFNASPLKLGDRIYGAVFSQLDITERKRAETEIQALAQQRQIALDAAHLGWWQYNPVTRVAEWDDGYKAIFGVSGYTRPNDEILAQIIHPDDLPGLWAKVEAALNPVDPQPYRAEYRINRPDGALRWIEAHGSVTFEGEGEDRRAVNLVGTVADITERKKAETDILQLSEDLAIRNMTLESVNKELESFIYSVSHDLRAPIRTMSGFAKIINEDYAGKLDAQGQDYLNRILKGSERSTQLIDDLLHLSKISRQELDRIEIDLSKKASKVAEELREMDPGRSVEVVIQEGMTASVDPRLIELALSNLIGNAWKFTSKKEKALIEFGAVNSLLRIADLGLRNEMMTEQVRQGKTVYFIRDNGDGFNMKYADKMFWPFHRLHADKEFEGTGIGLTIVERIIHRHGGKVWAESEVGKGAVFYFTL